MYIHVYIYIYIYIYVRAHLCHSFSCRDAPPADYYKLLSRDMTINKLQITILLFTRLQYIIITRLITTL